MVESLITIINEEDVERFSNGSILAGCIAEIYPEIMPKFRPAIDELLDICRNETGIRRKNAGILVAKLSRN